MNIYAITDSHQESRNLSQLLSEIYRQEKEAKEPFLVLDGGDLFKGIYDRELSVNAYIKLKELLPQAQIHITLGNNDFGFKKNDFEYLKKTITRFEEAGINICCANLIDNKTQKPATWIKPYNILELNRKKILVLGLCLNNSCVKNFNYTLNSLEETLLKTINSIQQKIDHVIILNHHWYSDSKNLYEFAQKHDIHIDLIIGGHEHSPITPDYDRNIYYPLSFARAMYKLQLKNKIENIKEIKLQDTKIIEEFDFPLRNYEERTNLKKTLAKRKINLPKSYSNPCPLGTFISDKMKEVGNTDIALHSTGFTMYPLKTCDSETITKYDLLQVMCANSKIVKMEISIEILKQIFENATTFRMLKDRGNARFVQCSQNIRITGKENFENNTYKILQIEINDEKLLDKYQNPIDNRKITCTIDSYISNGEQGFEFLKKLPKEDILINNTEARINEVFFDAIIKENNKIKTEKTQEYPSFKIIDL